MITEQLRDALLSITISKKLSSEVTPDLVAPLSDFGLEGQLRKVVNTKGCFSTFLKETRVREQLVDEFFDYTTFLDQKQTLYHNTGSLFLSDIQDCGLILGLVDQTFSHAVSRMATFRKKCYDSLHLRIITGPPCDAEPLEDKKISLSTKNPDFCSATVNYPAVLYEDLSAESLSQKAEFHNALSPLERMEALAIFQYGDRLRNENKKVELQCTLSPKNMGLYGINLLTKEYALEVIGEVCWRFVYQNQETRKEQFGTPEGLRATFEHIVSDYSRHGAHGERRLPFVSGDDLIYQGLPLSCATVLGPKVSDFALEAPKGTLSSYLGLD